MEKKVSGGCGSFMLITYISTRERMIPPPEHVFVVKQGQEATVVHILHG